MINNCLLNISLRIWFGIALTILGLITTAILIIFFGSTPIIGPVFISVGIGVYFLGLNVAVNGGIAQIEKNATLPKDNQINSSNNSQKTKVSPIWNSFIIALLILIALMTLTIVATISSHSKYASQIAGPAIGGVIAAFAGIIFSSWHDNKKENKRKQFLAGVFLSELQKIQGFIAGIEALNIRSDDFLITRLPGEKEPEYNQTKYNLLVPYFHDNPHIRTTENSPLVSKKNPFEIFAQDLYSFEDNDLISNLFKVDRLMNEASSYLTDFHNILGTGADGHLLLFDFIRRMERVKPVIEEILASDKLQSFTN